MKADPAVQRKLLDLAEVDAELNRINHRRRTLPELEEIGQAERDVKAKQDSLVASQTTCGDIERDATRLETEIEQVRKREQRDRKMLDEGTGSAKQLEDIQHELQTLARRQGSLEDELIEVMEQREALETDIERENAAATTARERLEDAQSRRDEAVADLESGEAKCQLRRKVITEATPADLLALYERVREHKGIGAGLIQSRRCGACRIELDRAAIAELKERAADDVVRCEECGAILVRTGESGL